MLPGLRVPVGAAVTVTHYPPRARVWTLTDVLTAFGVGLMVGALGMWAWVAWGPVWSVRTP